MTQISMAVFSRLNGLQLNHMTAKRVEPEKRLRVGYVLKSFPEPSETFIADEIASLDAANIDPIVLHINSGSLSVVHPSARAVMAACKFFRLGGVSLWAAAWAFARLFAAAPLRTLRAARAAFTHRHRWCYVQALPAAAWCLSQRTDVLHAHYADMNLIYAAAITAWTGVPYGVTTHRYDILDDPIDFQTAQALLRSASLLVTVSEFNRQHMVQKYGIPQSRIEVIHCGVDLNRFSFIPERSRQNGQPLQLLNVGRLVPIKAHEILLEALSIVRREGVTFQMEVIGGGELHTGLVRQCKALGLDDVVTFHGAQPEAVVRSFLANAHLFVLSSRSEGLPVACIEALATGTPVVATRIFGLPELITHGISGLLAPPDDAQALAEAILYAAKSESLRSQMSKAGREVVERDFDRTECTLKLSRAWRSRLKHPAELTQAGRCGGSEP